MSTKALGKPVAQADKMHAACKEAVPIIILLGLVHITNMRLLAVESLLLLDVVQIALLIAISLARLRCILCLLQATDPQLQGDTKACIASPDRCPLQG